MAGENADGNSEIFIMDVDGRNLRQLTHTTGANEHGTANYFPTINYAGKRVFYVTDLDDTGTPSDQHSIMFVNADGSGLRRLIDGSHPSVDAKGNVYFARGGTSLFRMQPDGTGVVGLPEVTTFGIERTSPDAAGARLAFGSVGIDGRRDVFVLDIKTGVTTQVTSTPGDVGLGCRQPSLSPDGRTIVFSCDGNLTGSNPDRNREVFVATLL